MSADDDEAPPTTPDTTPLTVPHACPHSHMGAEPCWDRACVERCRKDSEIEPEGKAQS